jgi:hypothetical protein
MSDLSRTIIEQFRGIFAEVAATSLCIEYDACRLETLKRCECSYRYIDVRYVVEEECVRFRDALVTIDYTGICFNNLNDCKWILYLKSLARELVDQICPKVFVFEREIEGSCRREPEFHGPFLTTTTTVVRAPPVPEPVIPTINVVRRVCKCEPSCCSDSPRENLVRVELVNDTKCIGQYEPKYHHPKPCCGCKSTASHSTIPKPACCASCASH